MYDRRKANREWARKRRSTPEGREKDRALRRAHQARKAAGKAVTRGPHRRQPPPPVHVPPPTLPSVPEFTLPRVEKDQWIKDQCEAMAAGIKQDMIQEAAIMGLKFNEQGYLLAVSVLPRRFEQEWETIHGEIKYTL
jgi:hypothetical protein